MRIKYKYYLTRNRYIDSALLDFGYASMPFSIYVNAMHWGTVLQFVWILTVSHIHFGQTEELGTVAETSAVLNHPYELFGSLSTISFYKSIATGLEAILIYQSTTNVTTHYNNYDPNKWQLVREINSASMLIHNTQDRDLSTYHSIIDHGINEEKVYNFTFLISDAVVQSFMIEGCDANQLFDVSTKPHEIATSCKELSVTSDQYDHPYDVHYGSPPDLQDNFTCQSSSCDAKIPLESFEIGDEIEIVIDLKLISDPPTKRTFQFIYIAAHTDPIKYIAPECCFGIVKLVVIIPVCECVILKAKGPAGTLLMNMWLVVGLGGVLVDVIVAAADIGAFYGDSDTNPDDSATVLGVNLGLALGVSAVLLIYAGIKHTTIDGCDQKTQNPTKTSPQKDQRDSGGLSGYQQTAMNGKPRGEDRTHLKTPTKKSRQGQLAPLGGGSDVPVQQIPTPRKLPALGKPNTVGPEDGPQYA